MTERDELPVPDYDHLSGGALSHRIRSLTEPDLRRLLDYERTHADRLPVRTLLENRIDALRAGVRPSSGDPAAAQSDQPPPPDDTGARRDTGQAVTNQPLRHGVADQTPNRPIRAR